MSNALFRSRLVNIQTNLLNFAFVLTSNKDDAYDLLQDTTLKALDNEDKFIDNTNFKGWVFTIMRNIFINKYRHMVRSATVVDTSEDLYRLNIPQDSGLTSPESSYAVNEITDAIKAFPSEYSVPFNLHLAGYRYSEIAERMHLPLGTIKSRIFYARQALREKLKDYKN